MPFDITSLTTGFLQNTFLLQAHGAEHGGEGGMLQYILQSNIINILIVVFVAGFLIKKFNLFSKIDDQRAKLASEIETAEQQKQAVLQQLEEAKRRAANLNAEVDEILRGAKESAETLSAQILANARGESAKIVDNARKRVELEQRSAAKDLERRLLNDALGDARSELARSLTPSDQKRSVETFLDELAQSGKTTDKGGRA